jgi:hypothetical protein
MYTVLRGRSDVPYIVPGERHEPKPVTGGPSDLNYTITRLCDAYICARGGASYTLLNEVIGVLECAKLELYRRVAAPYEDKKLQANGDVYASTPTTFGGRDAVLRGVGTVIQQPAAAGCVPPSPPDTV